MKSKTVSIVNLYCFLILVVVIAGICFLILNCKKDKSEIELLLTDTETKTTKKATKEKLKWPKHYDGENWWEVEYKEHINVHHPLGYVIITKIKKENISKDEIETWTIDYGIQNYVEEIHYSLKATHNNGGYEEEDNVFLPDNENFRNAFRTAEAILIAWKYSGNNPLNTEDIKKAAVRMKGRKTGLMRK